MPILSRDWGGAQVRHRVGATRPWSVADRPKPAASEPCRAWSPEVLRSYDALPWGRLTCCRHRMRSRGTSSRLTGLKEGRGLVDDRRYRSRSGTPFEGIACICAPRQEFGSRTNEHRHQTSRGCSSRGRAMEISWKCLVDLCQGSSQNCFQDKLRTSSPCDLHAVCISTSCEWSSLSPDNGAEYLSRFAKFRSRGVSRHDCGLLRRLVRLGDRGCGLVDESDRESEFA
jgi:hypothetical protein